MEKIFLPSVVPYEQEIYGAEKKILLSNTLIKPPFSHGAELPYALQPDGSTHIRLGMAKSPIGPAVRSYLPNPLFTRSARYCDGPSKDELRDGPGLGLCRSPQATHGPLCLKKINRLAVFICY